MLDGILKEKSMEPGETDKTSASDEPAAPPPREEKRKSPPRETGGPKGPDPTRYQDWERGGRCIDF